MRGLIPAAFAAVCVSIASGQSVDKVWSSNCMMCHGDHAQGGGAGTRTLLTDEWLGQDLDRKFFDTIKLGNMNSGMPAFGETMDDKQVWAMVVYLRELQEKARRERVGSPKAVGGVYQSKDHAFKLNTVVENGLDTPWAVDFLPDGALLITERPGRLRVFKDGVLSEAVAGTPAVRNSGQGGLMDVAVHPDAAKNGWIYLSYSDPLDRDADKKDKSPSMTRVVRGRVRDNVWTDEAVIFEADPKAYLGTDHHYGCKLVFSAPDATGRRYLFFGFGERGREERAQDLSFPNGKVFRVWDDGTVPGDNPFRDTPGAIGAIWSFGHRNPQGLTIDLEGALWDTEHGPRGGDELNRIEKGRNHGWPLVSFGINYSGAPYKTPWPGKDQDIAMPLLRWLPSIAASGLDVVRGGAFPRWSGDLIAGGLAGQTVQRIRVKDGRLVDREELLHGLGRVRDVACGPDGIIYIVLNDPHKVVRLEPAETAAKN